MNYGKVEERSSSRSRSPSTARRAATSAILTDILSRSDRAPTSRTAEARPRWEAGTSPNPTPLEKELLEGLKGNDKGDDRRGPRPLLVERERRLSGIGNREPPSCRT